MLLASIGILAIVLVILGLWIKSTINSPNSTNDSKISFTISPGEGSGDIATRLEKEKAIKNRFVFILYLNLRRSSDKIQTGDYMIPLNLTMIQLADLITEGQTVTNKITIPEGWTKEEIADYLSDNNIVSKEDFLAEIKKDFDYSFLSDKPKGTDLEGYLYPDTYILSSKPTAEEIVKKMLDNFDQKYTEKLRDKAKASNMNMQEIVTLASIVEREVASSEDRKTVAGIFLNRLNNDMFLESCATIQYILGEDKNQFSYAETRTPSPYNTYINLGLPEGPIGNPSMDSIEAVLYPTKSSYFYFLSADGKTYFSRTIDEHNAKKAQYLEQ